VHADGVRVARDTRRHARDDHDNVARASLRHREADRRTPVGLDDNSKFPNLTRALLEKGYSAADIGRIYGGNLLRVMRGVEATANQMR